MPLIQVLKRAKVSIINLYPANTLQRKRAVLTIVILSILLMLLVGLSASVGSVFISPLDQILILKNKILSSAHSANLQDAFLLSLRWPRIYLAGMVGATLATCGALCQGIFRNPLADPSLIGIAGGAILGVSVLWVLASSVLTALTLLQAELLFIGSAFVGSCIALFIIYPLASVRGQTSVTLLLLAGIAVGALAAALNTLLLYISDDVALRQVIYWQMGNLQSANTLRCFIATGILLPVILCVQFYWKSLNGLVLGESQARYLGFNVQRIKLTAIILLALGVGASVALAGVIGFVGLIVPHCLRFILGANHRYLLPSSALAGACLLIVADTLARTIIMPVELPVGIVTAIIGSPFFLFLLWSQYHNNDIQ